MMVGHKKSEKVLLSFLNAIMQDAYKKTITSVKVLNPELLSDNIADKKYILDIYAQDNEGSYYNIELQVARQDFFLERMMSYGGRMVGNQLDRGEEYEELKSSFVISIVDFIMFPNDPDYHIFGNVRKMLPPYSEIFNKMCYHIIELPKLKGSPKKDDLLQKWLYFIENVHKEEDTMVQEISTEIEEIAEARRIYDDAHADLQTRLNALSREKFLWDQAMGKKMSYKKGLAEGEAKGKAEGLAITARNLKAEGFDNAKIAKITGLSVEEIEGI